jgi:hypothetical protein
LTGIFFSIINMLASLFSADRHSKMQEEQAANVNSANAPEVEETSASKRERSSIQFPYGDLDSAIETVRAVHSIGGQSCEVEQLAGYFNVAPTGGGFSMRLSHPRIFGLSEYARGRMSLTPLGLRIIDPSQEAAARAEAFLTVPLYRAIYEKYKGYQLPPAAALEREMQAMGVSSKQTDKARQAFDRSARQAGFYWASNDRLTLPVTKAKPETRPLDDDGSAKEENKLGGNGGGGGQYHPFIQGLLKELPDPGSDWPHAKRIKWLRLAASAFDMIYEGEGSIEIKESST